MPLKIYQSTNKSSNYRINIMFDFENKWNAIKQAANSWYSTFQVSVQSYLEFHLFSIAQQY